ncbi:MAG: AAA family ATPase, partial [Cetobacterium somerae]
GKDYFLTRRDFHNIAIGHNRLVLKGYEKALANKKDFILVDTDHIITQVFFKRYLDKNGDRKLQDMINFQHYDLYIWLDPVPFEDDGTRRLVSESDRLKQIEAIKSEFAKNGVELKTIGNGMPLTLEQRVREIDKLFKYYNIIPKGDDVIC